MRIDPMDDCKPPARREEGISTTRAPKQPKYDVRFDDEDAGNHEPDAHQKSTDLF